MNDVPLRSYVYYALCELCDAYDNLSTISSRLEDESVKALVDDISNDLDGIIDKVRNLSL